MLDILAAGILIIIISPVWLLIVLWIRRDSPGPAIFKQTRVGLGGQPYTIYKFRTMVQNAEQITKTKLENVKDLDNFVFQEKGDSRITRSGRFLRKTSLDELPQLINVLIGNMSLVGPRPEIPEIVKHYTLKQYKRLNMPPGITGLAQVNGRGDLTLGETMDYDLQYVRDWSLWRDIEILWETVVVVFTGKGAY
ncbi:sugar transferase [Desulfosporosinus sp. Tol-M]|nr:sugar transferase [Desulfosporosinus sp. Tol-M]